MIEGGSSDALLVSSVTNRTSRKRGRSHAVSEYAIIVVCFVAIATVFALDAVLYAEYARANPSTPSTAVPIQPGAGTAAHFNDPSAPLCKSSSCKWLSDYLRQKINLVAKPCQDFNAYVCTEHKEPFVEAGTWNLSHSLRQLFENRFNNSGSGDTAALKGCAEGAGNISDVVLHHEAWADVQSNCNFTYPHLPLSMSEKYFKENGNGTVKGFAEYLFQRVPRIKLFLLRVQPRQVPRILAPWVTTAAKTVSMSALCHLKKRLNSTDDISFYTILWKMLYFSPFITSLYKDLQKGSLTQKSRLEACLDLIEDVFPSQVRSAGLTVLKGTIPDYDRQIQRLVDDAIHSLENHFKGWLSTNKNGGLKPLDTMKTVLLNEATSSRYEPTSPLSTSPLYSARKYSIPQGLIPVLLSHATNVDSILVPFLGADILRSLLSAPNTTAWTSSDAEAWNSHRSCINRQLNGSAALVNGTVLSSISISPLFVAYRGHVLKQYPKIVRLNANFTNEQLFFVLWAAGRCSEDADMVNAPLRNSERFTKAFRCATGQGMVPRKRCSFWIR